MLDFESLHIFQIAAETGNFTMTARRLHISQPAVSQHIQNLEQYLSVQLFERNGRRVTLSPAGEALLPLVNDLLRTAQQVEDAARSLAGEIAGHITLGCSTSSGKYLVPRILARYRERYPAVRAAVKVGPRAQAVDWLLSGIVDVAVTSDRVQRAGLHFYRFFEDEIVLIAPSDHPWATRSAVQPHELMQERFVLRETSSGTQMTLVETLENAGLNSDQLETVLVLDNSEAIVMAVEEGIGLGFVPKVTVQRHLAMNTLKVIPVTGIAMKRWLYLVSNTRRSHSPALVAFWDFVRETSGFEHTQPLADDDHLMLKPRMTPLRTTDTLVAMPPVMCGIPLTR